MKIPKWLISYLTEDGLKKIESAVKEAEKGTAGEVVPMIVKSSTTVGHVPMVIALILTTIYFSLDLYGLQYEVFDGRGALILAFNVAVFFVLLFFLSRFSFIQRWLTPKADQVFQVNQRAINEFYNHRIHHTENATGILVFVSLLERKAVVLGDDPISNKLDQSDWQEAVNKLVSGIKKKDMAGGFSEAIKMSGELLGQHFPIQKNDVNELKNHLIIKE